MSRITLISPRIAVQKGDFLGSGIPYWPTEMAIASSFLKEKNHRVDLYDLFGLAPSELTEYGNYYLQGSAIENHIHDNSIKESDAVMIYALSYMSHNDILHIVKNIKTLYPEKKCVVFENSQAVTAYSLSHVANELLEVGADFLICGELFFNWTEIESFIFSESQNSHAEIPKNIITKSKTTAVRVYGEKTVNYPIPDWENIPKENYWKLPYSHGPKTKTYFPIFTSRGCPYPCDFCVVPTTNERKWRARTAEEIVDEMLVLQKRFDVSDFQIEDLNPTIDKSRMEKICELLIESNSNIRFYIVSGTKAETVNPEKMKLFAKAGCRYISISPESGSQSVMKNIGKPFNYEHGLNLVKACRENGIRTQACFIVGHPSETEADFELSSQYLQSLVQAGLDEAAIFLISPFAGSQLFINSRIEMKSGERDALISFTPTSRKDYSLIESRRKKLIRIFFSEKLKKGADLWLQGLRAFLGTPQTKMENLPLRVIYIIFLLIRFRLGITTRKRMNN